MGVYIKKEKSLDEKGATITRIVENSPAEKAGIQAGDLVVSLGGQPIRSYQDLIHVIGLLRANAEIDIVVLRKNRKIRFALILAESF